MYVKRKLFEATIQGNLLETFALYFHTFSTWFTPSVSDGRVERINKGNLLIQSMEYAGGVGGYDVKFVYDNFFLPKFVLRTSFIEKPLQNQKLKKF